jgi:Ca2+-binding EF-hand superfamily protein
MDSNGNGMLDPDEMQGRARSMVERFAPGLDTSRAVSFDQIRRAVEKNREEGSGSNDRKKSGEEPLVPGFGEEIALEPILEFGVAAESFTATPNEEDMERAEQTIQRYDENRNGQLETDEIRRGRWSDDPYRYDRNKDGTLTKAELAVRYAVRREEEGDEGGDRRGNDEDRGGRDRGGRFGGWNNWGGGEQGGWGQGEGENRDRGEGGEGEGEGDGPSEPERKSYRFSTVYEGGNDAPGWFKELDQNKDGQVSMAEYSKAWDDALVKEFTAADLNGDGILTIAEGGTARPPGRRSSGGSNSSDSSGELASGAAPAASGGTESASSSGNSSSDAGGGVSDRYVKYAAGQIAKYDKDSDGKLNFAEWKESTSINETADADGDGVITAEELGAFYAKKK